MRLGDTILSLTNLLDVTPRTQWTKIWISDSVWIPREELLDRVYELGPPDSTICVTGLEALSAKPWLEARGYHVEVVESTAFTNQKPRKRLWRPSPLLPDATVGRALDIGCGAGRDSVHLASLGWQVIAIDHLPDAIAIARKLESEYFQPTIDFRTEDFTSSLYNDRYNLVSMIRSFRPNFLLKAKSLVAPNGVIVIEAFSHDRRTNVVDPDLLASTFADWKIERLSHDKDIVQFVARNCS